MTTKPKPEFCHEKHLLFLDDLRASGRTNMFGARAYLLRKFKSISLEEAGEILAYWMESFGERHP